MYESFIGIYKTIHTREALISKPYIDRFITAASEVAQRTKAHFDRHFQRPLVAFDQFSTEIRLCGTLNYLKTAQISPLN